MRTGHVNEDERQRVIETAFDWRARLGQPQAWFAIARHTIPILGVVFLGWSAAQSLLAIFFDSLTALYCLAAIAAYFIARETVPVIVGWTDRVRLAWTALFAWGFGAALLTFAVGVLFFFMWAILLGRDLALGGLLGSSWLWRSLGMMAAFQMPRFLQIVRDCDQESARRGVQRTVPALLIRLALIVSACRFIDWLPDRIALVAGLGVAQSVLLVLDLFGDILLGPPSERPRASDEGTTVQRKVRVRRR
jgi:hypothetical protein